MLDSLKSAVFGEDVREFALIRRRGQSSDPSKVKSYSRRKSPHEVELEEDLPVGRYVLQEIRESGDFGEQLWSEVLFGDESEIEEAIRRAEVAEKKAERAEQSASERTDTSGGFDDPGERLKYEIQSTIVEDENLLNKYGDELVGWALSDGLHPDAEVSIESLPGLVGYKSFQEPERAGELAEALSSGVAEGLGIDTGGDAERDAFSDVELRDDESAEPERGDAGEELSGGCSPDSGGPTRVGEASGVFEIEDVSDKSGGKGDDAAEVAAGDDAGGVEGDGAKPGEGGEV